MQVSKFLIARGLITLDDVTKAAAHQQEAGGRLDDCLVALGPLSQELLDEAHAYWPASPLSIEKCGITQSNLMPLLLKFMDF